MLFCLDEAFNLDAAYDAYYNLVATCYIETAMRNIIHNVCDNYLDADYIVMSEKYMYREE